MITTTTGYQNCSTSCECAFFVNRVQKEFQTNQLRNVKQLDNIFSRVNVSTAINN